MSQGFSLSFLDEGDIKVSFIIDKELKEISDEFIIKIEGDTSIVSLDREDWHNIVKFFNEYY